MKKIISVVLLIIISISVGSAQTGKNKKDPVGKWKFEAPYAPEGYTSGMIDVSFAEKKYSATMAFTGMDYKFFGESVKLVSDSLFFSINIEDEHVSVSLKIEDSAKMSGKAVYSEGVVPLLLTREIIEETK